MGDFNSAMTKKDKKSGKIDASTKYLSDCVKQLYLTDIWKKTTSRFYRIHMGKYPSRIDYIFISKHLDGIDKCCKIIHAPVSDHKATMLQLSNKNGKHGPNYWKLNVSVLKEEVYCHQIKELFDQVIQDCSKQNLNKCIIWDMFKIKSERIFNSLYKTKG